MQLLMMLKHRLKFDVQTMVLSGCLILALTTRSVHAQGTLVNGDISRIGDASHVEFNGLKQWPYDFKKIADNKYQLTLPALEPSMVARLSTWSDALISQVDVNKSGPDGQYVITFTTKDKNIETFDYLTDEPSRLIVDFYQPAPAPQPKVEQPASTATTVAASKPGELPKKSKSAPSQAADSDGYQKRATGQRKPAGDERLSVPGINPVTAPKEEDSGIVTGRAFDAADSNFQRFSVKDFEVSEEAIIASRQNIYVQFPLLKITVSLLPQLTSQLPEFVINPRNDRENKEARLLLSLYQRQIAKTDRTKDRIGAFLKVYDYFLKKYPESEYDEIVKNLAAHIYYLRWLEHGDPVDYDKSIATYKYLIGRYPESALTERTQQWVAFSELARGNGLGALQELQEYLRRYPKTEIQDNIQLAIAEGFLILNKYSDAVNVYRSLSKSSQRPETKFEAVYRIGDVALARKDYQQAEKDYKEALKQHPEGAKVYPNAYYNLAESQFWQRKHKEALENYVLFLKNHPNHDHSAYAMTRAGEILEALGADRSRVIGAYLESYYRFPESPGAKVARIRMLSQQMKGMKEKELGKAIEEMKEIAANSPLPKIDEFEVLMRSDGFQRRGDNNAALRELISFYQGNPTSTNLDLFKSRILRNISEVMARTIEQQKFIDTLQTQGKYAKTWLKNSSRIDIPYFIGQAFEQAGVFTEADKIYSQLLTKRLQMIGKPEERERKVNEILPSVEVLRLRQAAVAVENRDYPKAYQQLRELDSDKGLTPFENNQRIRLAAVVYKQRGQLGEAIRALRESISQWKGEPSEMAASQIELAELELENQEASSAEKTVDQILQSRGNDSKVSDYNYARALEIKAKSLQAQGKDLAAIEAMQKLLDDFEGQRPMGSIRFQVGQILFERGDLAGAEKVWNKLDPEKYSVFRKLAEERLGNARWQTEHKRYLKRIPAMSGFKGEQ